MMKTTRSRRLLAALTALLLALSCLCAPALADPLIEAEPLAGTFLYPEDATEEDAVYRFTYTYPQVIPQNPADDVVNGHYQLSRDDMLLFATPMYGELGMEMGADAAYYTIVSYEITCNNDDFFSVVLHQEQFLGATVGETITAQTFLRTGERAGDALSLSLALGLPEDLELEETGESRASRLLHKLVWSIIEEQRDASDGGVGYYDDLTIEDLAAEFYPEADFYLDAAGDLVFFIQPGMIASEVDGVLTYPFSLDELRLAAQGE